MGDHQLIESSSSMTSTSDDDNRSDGRDRSAPSTSDRPASSLQALHRLIGTDGKTLAGLVFIVAGLWGTWLQPVLSAPIRAFGLEIVLPGGSRHALVNWGLILALGAVFAGMAMMSALRLRRLCRNLAALFALSATIGFLVQSVTIDDALHQTLRGDEADLASLQRLMGYNIPRPSLTTLGPIPLSESAANVTSALRLGFYLALIGSALLLAAAMKKRRTDDIYAIRIVRVVSAVSVVLIAATVVQSAASSWMSNRAAASAAAGDDDAAAASYRGALDLSAGLRSNPEFLAALGLSQLRTGLDDGPAAKIAQSRLRLQAGKDLNALQIVATASRRWPDIPAVTIEFESQALAYLVKHGTPQPVRILIGGGNDDALLRVALAKYDLAIGDNPAAMDDARIAGELAQDNDVLSAALTFLSIAQSRAGDLELSRDTLLAAVDADEEYVNVMARSLLTGLYTTLPT